MCFIGSLSSKLQSHTKGFVVFVGFYFPYKGSLRLLRVSLGVLQAFMALSSFTVKY